MKLSALKQEPHLGKTTTSFNEDSQKILEEIYYELVNDSRKSNPIHAHSRLREQGVVLNGNIRLLS